jgi:hypothetical protein
MKFWRYVFLIIVALGLAACQAPKAVHDVNIPSGVFGPTVAKKLKPGGPDQPAWIYMNPKADWGSYSKMELDPVTFWRGPAAETKTLSRPDRQKLVNYFYQVIHKAMSQYLTMVDKPSPGTMRAQVAITKAAPYDTALDVISSVLPQAVIISSMKDAFTGKPAFVGEAAVACKVYDAQTNELLAAWLADRVGGKQLDEAQMSSWGDVEQAMRFWASTAAYRLCKLQKRGNCKKPPNMPSN